MAFGGSSRWSSNVAHGPFLTTRRSRPLCRVCPPILMGDDVVHGRTTRSPRARSATPRPGQAFRLHETHTKVQDTESDKWHRRASHVGAYATQILSQHGGEGLRPDRQLHARPNNGLPALDVPCAVLILRDSVHDDALARHVYRERAASAMQRSSSISRRAFVTTIALFAPCSMVAACRQMKSSQPVGTDKCLTCVGAQSTCCASSRPRLLGFDEATTQPRQRDSAPCIELP